MANMTRNKSTKRLTIKQKGGSNFLISYDLESGSTLPVGKWDNKDIDVSKGVGKNLMLEIGKMVKDGFIPSVLVSSNEGFVISIAEI